MGSGMKVERFAAIRKLLYAEGSRSIQEISEAIGASPATVRRDLHILETEGVVTRTHGGARIADNVGVEIAFQQREQQNLAAKRAIAERAYELIAPNSAIFLDAGTTVLQLARRLRLNPMPVTVFTNCLPVAQVLIDAEEVKVTLIGGALRAENASLVGPLAERMMDALWFDRLFLGGGALSDDLTLCGLDEVETHLNGKMLARSGAKTLLIDSSKFGHRLTYAVTTLTPELEIITDSGLPLAWQRKLREVGNEPILASVGSHLGKVAR